MQFLLALLLCCFAIHPARAGDQEDCRAIDNFDRAIPACTRILEAPDSKEQLRTWATFNRARASDRKGEYDRALVDYERVLSLDPKYLLAHYGRGVSFQRKGELANAKAAFDTAITHNPEFIEALYSRGIVHFDMGELDKAQADFDATIALSPAHAAAFSRRGMVYEKKFDLSKAIAAYRKALSIAAKTGTIHEQAHSYSRTRLKILGASITGPATGSLPRKE